jgi:hypothetical protein
MPNKISKRRVNAVSQGDNRGVLVPISRAQLEEAGVDSNGDIEVNRYVYDTDRAEIRLRLYEQEEEA